MSKVKLVPNLHRPKIIRGIDLDAGAHLQLFKVIFNSRMMGKTEVQVSRSPSGRGYHILCKEGFTMREAMILGDCKGRIGYWETQGYSFTFHNRHKRSGLIVGREEPYNPLSEPFWSLRDR